MPRLSAVGISGLQAGEDVNEIIELLKRINANIERILLLQLAAAEDASDPDAEPETYLSGRPVRE